MANKFSSLIFTEEGKDVMTKALADKGQMSIINAYTFTVSLTKDLTYSQISGLNPKQTKPMGTVTTDLTTNTVESRLIIDNRDVTADYNLKGIAITGVYGTDNYVLGIINTNETTLVPAYNGQSAQTINLDVSFAISDTSIVTVNTQYAGMLTVADYVALQKYIDQRDATKADDTAAVHKTGNETINDIKTFLKTIVGSVSGNSGTSDRVNTLAINANVSLSSLNNGVYLSTNASKTTSDKPTGAAETYVFVKESNVERFTDISNGQSYFRVKNGSTYTAWNRFSTAAELSNVDASAVHKTGDETIGGSKTFSSAIIANLQGNADTATKLKTARTISFSGAATGTGTFDGSGNVDIALTESATTRTNTSSAQALAVGGTVTIIDSITTNASGEITGVNVKTATMPSVYPPNNDSNLVHKSGAETIGGPKTFTDGLSGALAGNAASATKLANARKINGENFDGTADINVDPVVQVISTNKDVFTLNNGFYYYSNVSATNKPSGSSNYFVVEVIQSGNNGFMQLVDSNNNAWWTTKTGGAWGVWKAEANDALVAHLANSETFTGKKTFSAGISTTNLDVTDTTNLKTLNVANPINGAISARKLPADAYDFAVLASNMTKYQGIWYTDGTAIANGPTDSWSWNTVEVLGGYGNGAGIIRTAGFRLNQEYITTVNSGKIVGWKKVANETEVVRKTGDTMTGDLISGADPAMGGTGTRLYQGGMKIGHASIPWFDFHVNGSTTYSSHFLADTDGIQASNNGGPGAIISPVLADANHVVNIDTMSGGNPVLKSRINFSVMVHFIGNNPASGTLPPNFDNYGTLVHYGISDNNATQIYYETNNERTYVRYMASGSWKSWHSLDDIDVVHKTGNETIAGDKTFTGKVSIPAVTSVVTREVSGTNGISFKFRRTGNAVHVEISGSYTGTNWTSSSTPSYAAELFSVVVPTGFAPDNWSQSEIIEYGSAVGFGRYNYDTSSKKMTFTYRGMTGVVTSSKYIVSSVSYSTSDSWPG